MKWDESKHPRDELGRFTNVNGTPRTFPQNTRYGVILGLDYFSEKKARRGKSSNEPLPAPPLLAYGFANKERLNTEHHVKHAAEMGYKSQREYERAAIEFWNSGQGKLYYSPLRKHYYLYNSKESLILSVDSGGIIHTFFSIGRKKFDKLCVQERLYVY